MNLFLATCLFLLLIVGCSGNEKANGNVSHTTSGELIYKKNCTLCHGSDGKLGINGSKDLTVSILSLEERKVLIRSGKNLMTPFKGVLSEDEIHAVAAYTMTMKTGQ